MDAIIETWKGSLSGLLHFYDLHRGPLFIFFLCYFSCLSLSISCFIIFLSSNSPILPIFRTFYGPSKNVNAFHWWADSPLPHTAVGQTRWHGGPRS